jgi:membrane protein
LLFTGVRFGLTWFVVTFNSFNLVYGSLGTIMAVLAWAYFSSQALMCGAQVSATYSRLFGTLAQHEQPAAG